MFEVERYHDICCGHKVTGHEGKCRNLHGHNYRFHFTIESEGTDLVGRVIDFSVIKERLCEWLEQNWDHKFLIWQSDIVADRLVKIDDTVILTPFNPTAENIAKYFVEEVAPKQLEGTGVKLTRLKINETEKCSASYTLK